MKFVISTQEFSYLISKCQHVVPPNPTMPILSNILIEAKNGELTLTATDLTVGVRCFTEAKVLEEGSTTLPAKKLASLIRELTSMNVEVTTNENHVTEIIADSSKFKLHGMAGSNYPELPSFADATPVKMSQEQLKEMFFRTSFAVSKDDTRYALTGVFLHVENGKASFVGTDGKRLARTHLGLEIDPSYSGSFIVPIKAVDEILKNLKEEGDVTLYLLNDKIAVETENSLHVSKLLSGDYPDVNRVIPDQSGQAVTLHREELLTLLRQVSLFTAEGYHSVRFSFGNGEVKLSANTKDIGEGNVSMPVNYHAEQIDIAFDPTFFMDILKHTRGERVTLGVTDSFNPGVITDSEEGTTETSGHSPLFVLMPMRLSENVG